MYLQMHFTEPIGNIIYLKSMYYQLACTFDWHLLMFSKSQSTP